MSAFDDALRAEIARMGELMEDALGIGLAANQVGRLRRLLVYRVEPDSPLQALVNPEIDWRSKDQETFEEGCLSLRGVMVDVERPIHVRVRARDGYGERDPRRGVGPRGARHPARDGPSRRRPDPRPRAARPAPRGDAHAARARRRGGLTALPCAASTSGPRTSRPACLRRLAQTPHRPQLVVTRPDRPAGRGRKLAAAAGRRRPRASSASSSFQPETSTTTRRARASPPPSPTCCCCAPTAR